MLSRQSASRFAASVPSTSTSGALRVYNARAFSIGPAGENRKKEKLVILGTGWGGYTVASKIDKKKYDVTVISPTGYFTFTPLLASTAVGTLEFRVALEPVRRIEGIKFLQARAEDIDVISKKITLQTSVPNPVDLALTTSPNVVSAVAIPPSATSGKALTNTSSRPSLVEDEAKSKAEEFMISYDKLVVSVGCFSATFGTKGVYEHANFLKDVRDARAIRKRILDCFERASQPFIKEKEKRDLLSFRIVGGGPTGVEFSGELHDLIVSDMQKIYPELVPYATITLYDVAPGILLSFEESLREYAMKQFLREGVQIKPNSRVKEVGEGWMDIEGEGKVPFGLLVWSTGLSPNPLIAGMKNVFQDPRSKSLITDANMNIFRSKDGEKGEIIEDVFAIGDNSMIEGLRMPATAQVAGQKGTQLAANLNGAVKGLPPTPFELRSRGSMVYLGSWRAMIDRTSKDVDGIKGKDAGSLAWFLWRSAYWGMAMSWRNRLLMSVYWGFNILFGRDISRF